MTDKKFKVNLKGDKRVINLQLTELCIFNLKLLFFSKVGSLSLNFDYSAHLSGCFHTLKCCCDQTNLQKQSVRSLLYLQIRKYKYFFTNGSKDN